MNKIIISSNYKKWLSELKVQIRQLPSPMSNLAQQTLKASCFLGFLREAREK